MVPFCMRVKTVNTIHWRKMRYGTGEEDNECLVAVMFISFHTSKKAKRVMTQDERWMAKFIEVKSFIEKNQRNPSKHIDEERGLYLNWIKHNRKLYSAGLLKEDRAVKFRVLLELSEQYKRKNQYM